MTIILATQNPDKAKELQTILINALRNTLSIITLFEIMPDAPAIEETGATLEENAAIKARAIFSLTHLPTVADDTGLEIEALNSAPGVYSARYAGEHVTYDDNVWKVLSEMRQETNRRAVFATSICYIDQNGREFLFRGEVPGVILDEERGENGFGYDPIFVPETGKDGRTYAEMLPEEKNRISHRTVALRKLIAHLTSQAPSDFGT